MWSIFLWACIPAHTYNRSYSSDFPDHYREVISTWEGKTSDDLLLRWGNPYQMIVLSDESTVYEYLELKTRWKIEESYNYDLLIQETINSNATCITRFKVSNDGKITDTDAWGSLCSSWVEPKKAIANPHTDYINN